MSVEIQGHIRAGAEVVADIDAAVAAELARFGVDAVAVFQARWIGFRHPTGRSRDAWRAEPVQRSGVTLSIDITNDARAPGGKPYAAYVHTPGNPEPLAAYLQVTAIDPMARDLVRRLSGLPEFTLTED